jgi:hypothetical protein
MKEIILTLARDVGASAEAIKKWRQRGYVPPKRQLEMMKAAKRKNLRVADNDFRFPPTAGARGRVS